MAGSSTAHSGGRQVFGHKRERNVRSSEKRVLKGTGEREASPQEARLDLVVSW